MTHHAKHDDRMPRQPSSGVAFGLVLTCLLLAVLAGAPWLAIREERRSLIEIRDELQSIRLSLQTDGRMIAAWKAEVDRFVAADAKADAHLQSELTDTHTQLRSLSDYARADAAGFRKLREQQQADAKASKETTAKLTAKLDDVLRELKSRASDEEWAAWEYEYRQWLRANP